MRIEIPTWVNIDHPTYHSVSLNVATARGPGLLQTNPAMVARVLGSDPALLLQLEQEMTNTRYRGDWAARLWSVSPVPRFAADGTFIFGWRADQDDVRFDGLIHAWQKQVGRPIDAVQITWECFAAPTVKHLIDLASPQAPPHTITGRNSIQIAGAVLIVHTYQFREQPLIRAAYDSETHTLYCLI